MSDRLVPVMVLTEHVSCSCILALAFSYCSLFVTYVDICLILEEIE